jgi:putative endonuclease
MGSVSKNNRWKLFRANRFGEEGESIASDYLIANGYRIVMANFKVPVGRNSKGGEVTGEIDLIALDGETLCFIEVKARDDDSYTSAFIDVDLGKQRQITRTGRVYKRIFGISEMLHRYDAVTVIIGDKEPPRVELYKGFWTDEQFRKQRWIGDVATDLV